MRRATRLTAILAALCALFAAGCGSHAETVTQGETEGIYLDIGELKYQVQVSRNLNPRDIEDRAYLKGLPPGSQPADDETWFGVFLRVQNTTEETLPPARTFEIVDTQEGEFEALELDTDVNAFAYEPRPVPPGELLPEPDSPASDNTIQGSLLLFKMTVDSLGNRPLELEIESRQGGDNAIVDLDV